MTIRTWILAVLAVAALATAGGASAQLEDGLVALSEGDYEAAAAAFRRAAEEGDDAATYNLGLLHEKGLGVKQDHREALRWFRRGAEAGYPPAWYSLGLMYLNGNGVEADPDEARSWLSRSARKGYAPARFTLGMIAERADRHDEARAEYDRAAMLRFPPAMMRVGMIEAAAIGQDGRDRAQVQAAYAWFTLALLHGMDAEGFAMLNRAREQLALTMTPDEIAAATRDARAWLESAPGPEAIIEENPLAHGWIDVEQAAGLVDSPEVAFADYLEVRGADFVFGFSGDEPQGVYVLTLAPADGLERSALVEVGFENPNDPRDPLRVRRPIGPADEEIRIESPPAGGFGCRPYRVAMAVYDNETRERMVGVMRIVVSSIIDTSVVESREEMVEKLSAEGHACP